MQERSVNGKRNSYDRYITQAHNKELFSMSDQQFGQKLNLVDLNLNQKLRQHSALVTYKKLLKQNINLQPKVVKYTRKNHHKQYIFDPIYQACNSFQNFSTQPIRHIPKTPYKILDAPHLRDDFYYDVLDWSCNNYIAIGLDNFIYTWTPQNIEAQLFLQNPNSSSITSLKFHQLGHLLTVGDQKGILRLFDVEKKKNIRSIQAHTQRIGAMNWGLNILATGSRDSQIITWDIRIKNPLVCTFQGHKQQVCGVKWSPNDSILASGGNDNKVFIWSLKMQKKITHFSEHTAAVKALAWSLYQPNTLITGGGTTDKTLKFWNTNTLKMTRSIDTGSQICNMIYSKNSNQIITTHGFSVHTICSQQQLAIWREEDMQKLATLYGHTLRVLYLTLSPDGQTILTGSGDESVRFWRVLPRKKECNKDCRSELNLNDLGLR